MQALIRILGVLLMLTALVVTLTHAVEVDDPREVRRRLEEIHLLLHQDRVRAEEHELPALDQLARDDVDLGRFAGLLAVEQRPGNAAGKVHPAG